MACRQGFCLAWDSDWESKVFNVQGLLPETFCKERPP
jgi:hypothetical protein